MNDRAVFANDVCKLVYQKHKGDLELCIDDIKVFYDHFFEHVRNIYELVQDEIPLFWLYELKKSGAENFDMSVAEYQREMAEAAQECLKNVWIKKIT